VSAGLPVGPARRVVQVTDTHLLADPDGTLRGCRTDATLHAVLERVRAEPTTPDLLALTGDLVHDCSEAGYARLADHVRKVGTPVCWLPGNHDDPERMRLLLGAKDLPWRRSLQLGSWLILCLSTQEPGEDHGRLAPEELDALATALSSCESPHVLLCLHHPPLPIGSRGLDGLGLRNAETLWALVETDARVRGIVCGHIHQEFAGQRGSVRVWGTPSTCVQFRPGSDDFAHDDRPPGFRRVDLFPDGRIRTEVVWVGGVAGNPP
jgi:Icc protein